MKNMMKMMVVGVLVASALVAVAQGGGRGQGQGGGRGGMMMGQRGGGGDLMLLGRADVQRDLKLDDAQKAALTKLQEQMREEMMNAFQNSGGDREASRAAMEALQKKSNDEVKKILKPEQSARLKQINIQIQGNRAVFNPEIQKELGLTEAQKTTLTNLQTKQREANQAIMEKVRNGEIDREELRPLQEKNNKIMDEEIAKVLTDANKAKLKEMSGEPFKADPQQPRGPGGNN